MEGRGVPEEDRLFYSILFRCGIYKGSKIGSERKANILLNWRPPQHRQLQPSLSSFCLPVLSSMTWFEDHLQWDQKVIFPSACSTCHFTFTLLVNWMASMWDRNEFWPPLVEPWIIPGKTMVQWRSNLIWESLQSPRDVFLPWWAGASREVVTQNSLSSAGNSLISPAWGIASYPGKGSWKYKAGSCWERVDVLISAGLFSYRAGRFSHLLSSSPFLLSY